MKLNHINLPVSDVAGAIRFFEKHFGFNCTEVKGDNIVAVLTGKDGFVLVLMKSKTEVQYPREFHIGFLQETRTAVNNIFESLGEDTSLELRQPGKIRDTYGFYFYFDRVMIEVSVAEQG